MQVEPAFLRLLRVCAQLLKGFYHHSNLVIAINGILRTLVILKIFVIHDCLNTVDVESLTKLQRRKLNLGWTTSTKDVHIGHWRVPKALVDVIWNVCSKKVIWPLSHHASHVKGNVSVTDYCNLFGVEWPTSGDIRMGVVPIDKVGRSVGAIKINARYC